MKITWLGQAGLLFEYGNIKIMIDPYLSDSVAKVNPKNYRRAPLNKELFDIEPDIMIFTHDHLDHYDPETAPVFLAEGRKNMTVLCPCSVWSKARQNGKDHNYVLFDSHTEWTEHGLRFIAVRAAHSDPSAIGVIIEELASGKSYYVTGDTLYSTDVIADIKRSPYSVLLPINGVGNNMNAEDAERFARDIGAFVAIPLHFGMFDEIDPEIFGFENKIIPKMGKEIEL